MLGNRPAASAANPLPSATTALRREIGDADDEKIGKIIAYVDRVGDAEVNRSLLDALRGRVGSLAPARPLRLSRLLFVPLDPLIVSPGLWRPGSLRIPRTALAPLFALVARQFGADLAAIDAMVEGQTCSADATVAQAGAELWPRAAAILRTADPPPEWGQTSLPESVFRSVAQSIAVVLQRAVALGRLARAAKRDQADGYADIVGSIVANVGMETAENAAMVVQLVLLNAPKAIVHVRRFVSATANTSESITLHRALSLGIEQSLSYIEQEADCVRKVASGSIPDATAQVRLVAQVLNAIEADASATLHRRRIRNLREQMDRASQACFDNGIREQLATPLAALTQPVSVPEQNRMEVSARELRALDGAARDFVKSPSYEEHLLHTAATVRSALDAGTITLPRACRLLEILSGPEAAVALYRRGMQATATAASAS